MHTQILQRSIRQHFVKLIGEDRLLIPTVSRPEADAFAAGWNLDNGDSVPPCCTESSFRIDLLGTPHSPWNQSAARVFCSSFIRFHHLSHSSATITDITNAFYTRVKTLKSDYATANQRDTGKPRHMRRWQRKRTVGQFLHGLDIKSDFLEALSSETRNCADTSSFAKTRPYAGATRCIRHV